MQEALEVGVHNPCVQSAAKKITDVAGEIVAELAKKTKHHVTIFTRKVWNFPSQATGHPNILKDVSTLTLEGAEAVQVDYSDRDTLTKHLQGVNTVLSFIADTSDPTNLAERNLIDASIAAGVKRFAPNEWAT